MDLLDTVRPRYGTGSLAEVVPSALAVLGMPGAVDGLDLAAALDGVRRIAVLLVDGLGFHLLPPALTERATHVRRLTAGFPSTTPTSLVSLGTGASPGAHGILGFHVRIPGTDRVLTHTHWDSDPDPLLWQPLTTQFALANEAGIAASVINRPEFAGSGLTRAAYRGGRFHGAAGADEVAEAVLRALADSRLVYGYHADLDRVGHIAGVDSDAWRTAVSDVDRLVDRIAGGLPADAALLVTADHGQLDVPADHRFDVDTDARLREGVRVVAGESRVRYLHVEDGAAADVLATWRGVLGTAAWVATREEAVAAGWFGPVPEAHLQRVGDIVVACHGRYAVVASRSQPLIEAQLVAYHGSYTAVEMEIPLLLYRR